MKIPFAVMSREFFTKFDIQTYSEKIVTPFLMIHSQNALSPHWAESFYNNVRAEKSCYLIESSGQTDFYDDPSIVDECAKYINDISNA